MAINLNEYRKKYSDTRKKYIKANAIYEKVPYKTSALETAQKSYNTLDDALGSLMNYSEEELDSALKKSKEQQKEYKTKVLEYAKLKNVETNENNLSLKKNLANYNKESLQNIKTNKYDNDKYKSQQFMNTAVDSGEKFKANQQKFDNLIKNTNDYQYYDTLAYKSSPILNRAKYYKKLSSEETDSWDKAVAPFWGGLNEALNYSFGMSSNNYRLANNELIQLPSEAGLKAQKVMGEVEDDDWYGKLYSTTTYSIGNMLPSVAVGTINPVAGTTLMAAQTYNQTYNATLSEGYTKKEATNYATANAALEVFLGKLLGGMEMVTGKTGLSSITKKITGKIFANKATRDILANMGSEFTEEYLQEYLDPIVRNKLLNENNEVKFFSEENLIAGLSGAINSGIYNLPNYVANNNKNNYTIDTNNINSKSFQESIINDAVNSKIEQNNIKVPILNENQNINLPSSNNQSSNIFSQQIDEVLKGTYPKRDMLVVSKQTPQVLQEIGLRDLPITMTQKHLYTMTHSEGKYENANYHDIDVDVIKQLPQALEHPLNVLKSDTKSDSIVVITELADKNGDIIVASIKIDGKGTVQDIRLDSNVMTSAYGKSGNYDYFMQDNISKGNLLYDIDEGVIQTINNNTQKKSDVKDRVQFPMRDSSSSTSTSDIPKNTSPISYNNNSTNSAQSQIAPLPLNNMQNNNNNIQDVNLPNFNSVMNPLEISQLTQEDANTTPILPNIQRNQVNDGESKFYSNIRDKTNMLNEQQKKTIMSEEEVQYYDKITNKESLFKAFEKLNENGANETLNWFSKDSENATAIDVAEGWILLKQYADNNDTEGMVAVAKKMREIGTKAGQTVQAFNIMERMTPEGMVKYAQSELLEAYDRMVKGKTQKWIDKYQKDFNLTPQETATIMEIMKKVTMMEDGYNKRVELAKIQKIMTDKLPPTRGSGIKSWMRISMLFNLKTQVRNVAGNAIIAPVNAFSDLFASAADKVVGIRTGYRTTGVTNIQNYVKGFKEGAYQSYNDFKKGINTRNIQGNRFEIGEGKSFNNNTLIGKSLNKVDNLLSFMLDAGDRTFYEATFTNSINNQLVLNNTTEVTQEMVDIATQEALSRTWQDNNNYTKFVLNVRKMLNNINLKGYGLGDVLIPFAKTPANLTKAIVDYSPAGLVNTLVKGNQLKNAIKTGQFTPQMQHEFVQSLGKATVGTMLYIAGYALAKNGIVSGESDDDKDVRDFMKNNLGINSYSIKIGNKSFTYDWAQPIAAPLSIMANIVQKDNEEANTLEKIISSLDTAGNILLEQSFMESINTALSNNDGLATGIEEAILDLPSRAIPTFMKQIVDLTDNTQRTSFEYDKPIQSMINSVKAKIPGLSKTLAPSVDTMGREIQRYGGKNNIFNVFLNPANVSTENISKSASEIYRLYKETGDKTIMPRVAPYYINQNGEKITLDSKTKAEYQKISGSIIEESIEKLLDNDEYQKLSDIEKATIIKSIVDFSYNKAKEEVLDIPMSKNYDKINQYLNMGGNVADYYMNKDEINYFLENPTKYATILQITEYNKYLDYKKELDNIRDNTENKKEATIEYINSLHLSIPQKAMFIRQYYSSYDNYNEQIVNYVKQNVNSVEDRSAILTELGFTIRNGRVYW